MKTKKGFSLDPIQYLTIYFSFIWKQKQAPNGLEGILSACVWGCGGVSVCEFIMETRNGKRGDWETSGALMKYNNSLPLPDGAEPSRSEPIPASLFFHLGCVERNKCAVLVNHLSPKASHPDVNRGIYYGVGTVARLSPTFSGSPPPYLQDLCVKVSTVTPQ